METRIALCKTAALLFPTESQIEALFLSPCADRICNFNRHYAEFAGYWESTSFLSDVQQNIESETGEVTFYDSGWKGSPLFTAPRDRSWEDFIKESTKHGWPSFRDSEVDWDYARVLPDGEMVSIDGTHLGHNLPDSKGNRYCISKYRNTGRFISCSMRMCMVDIVRLCCRTNILFLFRIVCSVRRFSVNCRIAPL